MTSTWKNLTPAAYNHITMQKGKNTLTYMNKVLKFIFRFPAYFLGPELITKNKITQVSQNLHKNARKKRKIVIEATLTSSVVTEHKETYFFYFFFFKLTNFPFALITLQWKRSFRNQSTKYVFLIGFA